MGRVRSDFCDGDEVPPQLWAVRSTADDLFFSQFSKKKEEEKSRQWKKKRNEQSVVDIATHDET